MNKNRENAIKKAKNHKIKSKFAIFLTAIMIFSSFASFASFTAEAAENTGTENSNTESSDAENSDTKDSDTDSSDAEKSESENSAAENSSVFSDVTSSPYKEAVESLVEKKVINGYEDGTFRPNDKITRAEVCVVIAKAMNPSESKYSEAAQNTFSDTQSGYDWAKKYINYAAAMKAVDGYTDGTFKPGENVTYNELAAMILKAMGYRASDLSGEWPDNFKNKAVELGLFNGIFRTLSERDRDEFYYQGKATRGDAALMIYAAYDKLKLRGIEKFPTTDEGKGTPVYEDGRYTWISGTAKTLSLSQAIKIMQNDGYLADNAKLNKDKDQATADGYVDNVSDIKSAIKALKKMQSNRADIDKQNQDIKSSISSLESIPEEERTEEQNALIEQQKQTSQQLEAALTQVESALEQMTDKSVLQANQKVAELQRDFTRENIDKNYEAEMNSIEYQTVSVYYGFLQAKENLQVSEENLELQQKILKNTKLKLSVGKATQLEVTAQELSVKNAEQAVKDAKTTLETAKLNFNLLLGYDTTANVELTDELTPLPFPETDIEQAAEKAFNNNLSVIQLEYAIELQKLSLDVLKESDGKNSGAYEKQESALELTEYTYETMPKTLEIQIRSAYTALMGKYDTVLENQQTLATTKESLKSAELLYKAGMGTATDIQQAQVSVDQTNQLVMSSIADYNLAVYEFKYMLGVGKERIDF